MLNFGKKKKDKVFTEIKVRKSELEEKHPSFFKEVIKKKKELLSKDGLTKEEILKEIEKEFLKKQYSDYNPFKTREDYYLTFFNSNMEIVRKSVPFEEILVSGRAILIRKEFRNGEIIIKELYPFPQLEINLEEEHANKENTKKQLEKINKYLLFIKNKIASGEEKYNLIDIEDIKEEKIRLEKILESIKYGKTAIFHYQDPTNNKKHFWLRYKNGEYQFLKVTENNYIVEENNIRMVKGNNIIKRVEQIVNMRKNVNFRGILWGIGIFLVVTLLAIGLFKLVTFDEALFDKRVNDALQERTKVYTDEINFLRKKLNEINPKINYNNPNLYINNSNKKSFQTPK